MIQNIQNYITKFLAICVCMLLIASPLKAAQLPKLDLYIAAEGATALMRGIGSSVEYSLKDDTSKSAHFKRTLISGVRVAHDVLAIINHQQDYKSYYLEGLGAVDSLQMGYRIIQLMTTLRKKDIKKQIPQEEFFLSSQTVQEIALPTQQLEFVRKYVLPVLESSAALYLAGAPKTTPENEKMLFAAQAVLALARTCQLGLDQESKTGKIAAGTVALALIAHAVYQLQADKSGLNTWLKPKLEKPNDKPRTNDEPNDEPSIRHDVRLTAEGLVVGDLAASPGCPLCLDPWHENDNDIAIIHCRHAFCHNCLAEFLRNRDKSNREICNARPGDEMDLGNLIPLNCPVCREGFHVRDIHRVAHAAL